MQRPGFVLPIQFFVFIVVFTIVVFGPWLAQPIYARRGGQLVIKVIDRDTKKPIACRIHLKRLIGKRQAVVKGPKVPNWDDHFIIDGEIKLNLLVGNYTFVMERGPEYLIRTGHFRIDDFANDEKVIDLKRFVNMASKGWYAGDLHAYRSLRDIEKLMRAEDLYVVPVTTWTNKKNKWKGKSLPKNLLTKFDNNRFYHATAGYDLRMGNMVQFFQLEKPMKLPTKKTFSPTTMSLIKGVKKNSAVHINVGNAFSWDLPIWIAHESIDSISLANSHLQRSKVLSSEAGGMKRDRFLYPKPHGNGRWSQAIYYRLLNCGLRIPPAAGSGSGEVSNPLGYNRVYVHVDGEFTYEKW